MKDSLSKGLCALQTDRRGIAAMEYALIAGVVVTVLAGAFTAFFGDLQTALATIGAAIPT